LYCTILQGTDHFYQADGIFTTGAAPWYDGKDEQQEEQQEEQQDEQQKPTCTFSAAHNNTV
jgi:hypothetical protein